MYLEALEAKESRLMMGTVSGKVTPTSLQERPRNSQKSHEVLIVEHQRLIFNKKVLCYQGAREKEAEESRRQPESHAEHEGTP